MKKIAAALIAVSMLAFPQGFVSVNESGQSEIDVSEEIHIAKYVDGEILVMYADETLETLKCADDEELSATLCALAEDENVLLYQPNYRYNTAGTTVNDEYYGEQWALNNDGTFTMEAYQNKFPVYDVPFTKPSLPGEWNLPGYFGTSSVSSYDFSTAAGTATTTLTATEGIDINAEEAWEIYNGGEREVIIAIIDTGIDYTHPELADAMWINEDEIPDNGIDDDNNGYIDDVYGWNFYDDSNVVYSESEYNDHGTHCAGIIAAKANNGEGIAGIVQSGKVKIMCVKALGGSNGTGTSESLVRAIRYAEANGASICNLSLGGYYDDQAKYREIAKSSMLFSIAAGNDGVNTDVQAHYPSGYDLDNIISVANLSCDGTLHYSSNYGVKSVDIAAPGTYIFSTTPDNSYSYMTGTSMAAPMVTAAAAMIYSHYANISLADVKEIILKSARKLSSLAGTCVSGGMLDLYAALTYDQSLLSGAQWTAVEYENSAPEITIYTTSNMGGCYISLRVTDPDYDYMKIFYAAGELTAADFKKGQYGTEIEMNGSMFSSYIDDGTYTFYAVDEHGNESVKTITVEGKKQDGNSSGSKNTWINDFFDAFAK
ncbi:MAG: S8 family serine peptidase [Clostridia bacterium]|nr:S8 family serine peptidase [Clostridia bacterium]